MTLARDMSLAEAARRLGMSPYRLRNYLRSGAVPTAYQTEGGQWRMQESGLEEWTRERGYAG